MPHFYWAKAVSRAVYIMNMTPTAAIHDVMHEEKFSQRKHNLTHLKVFGCIAYVHVLNELRTKLDPKAKKCVFIGYSLEQKGYRCYNPITREIRVSRDVVFDEMSCWYDLAKVTEDANARNSNAIVDVEQQSKSLSGPSESSTNGSNAWTAI